MGRHVFSLALILLIALQTYLDTVPAYAQSAGDLMVAPTRMVFSGRKRAGEINLVNRGSKEATYRISFKNMTMKEDGSYEDIQAPVNGEKFADDMLRFSPRQVTLQPGEVQKVRLMVRKPANLPPGEYRSHMLFRGLPPEDIGEDVEATLNEGEVRVKLIPVFGVSIPVIIQQGNLSSEAEITHTAIEEIPDIGGKQLALHLKRHGDASIYGDIIVNYRADGDSTEYVVAQLRGISILAPYEKRQVYIPLQSPKGVSLSKGVLDITYREKVTDGGKLIASSTYTIP